MISIPKKARLYAGIAGLVAVGVLTPSQVVAALAVSNLGETSFGAANVPNSDALWVAGSFQTGPAATTLTSVDLLAQVVSGAPSGFSVSLYADNDGILGGNPTSLISLLVGPQPGVASIYNYIDPASTTLAASTPYWIVAKTSGSAVGVFGWLSTFSTADSGLAGWSIFDGSDNSSNLGANWSTVPFVPQLAVNIARVPEASTWAAVGILAWMTAWAGRRSVKRSR